MSDFGSESESDLDEEELSLDDKIKKLQKSVDETRSMLESINLALLNQGNPREVLYPKVFQSFKPQSGIRINNELSFRGEQMCDEYWDYLDEDQQDELHDYFIESKSDNIEMALKEFDGEYDEFELKLFRIKFLSDLAN